MDNLREQLLALPVDPKPRNYQRHDVIWNAGDSATSCMLLLVGQVAIETAASQDGLRLEIATRSSGDLIGEMSLFSKIRSARVICTREVQAIEFRHTDIIEHLKIAPDFALRLLSLSYERVGELTPRI